MMIGLATSTVTVRSVLGAVVGLGIVGLVSIGLGSIGSAVEARAQDFRCVQSQSAQEVQRLTAANAIISIDVFMPNVTVVVDDRAWNRRGLDEKKALAQNVDCATAGPNNTMLRTVLFRSNKTNRELAEFSHNQLTIE